MTSLLLKLQQSLIKKWVNTLLLKLFISTLTSSLIKTARIVQQIVEKEITKNITCSSYCLCRWDEDQNDHSN